MHELRLDQRLQLKPSAYQPAADPFTAAAGGEEKKFPDNPLFHSH